MISSQLQLRRPSLLTALSGQVLCMESGKGFVCSGGPAHCTDTWFAGTRKGQPGGDKVTSDKCQFKVVAGLAAVNQFQQAEPSSRASPKVYCASCSPLLPKLFQVSTFIDLLDFNTQGYK
ncbi:hypothetical protein EK904_007357 [Melospiza melodia maxima]|nr:hypothetical protein EK904_007357 [Melospiza melodia maxima]